MTNKSSRVVQFLLMLIIVAAPAWAVPVELNFTNADVDMGDGSVIDLVGGEYAAFGINVSSVYRYIDGRDPFSDAPDDVGAPCPNENPPGPDGRCNFGLSNGDFEAAGRIDFLAPQSNVSFDWWVLGGIDPLYQVLDPNGLLLLEFSPAIGAFGTQNVPGDVGSILWFNAVRGFSSVANIRYGENGRVPEPGSVVILALGLLGLGVRSRRHS